MGFGLGNSYDDPWAEGPVFIYWDVEEPAPKS
jgi:hypothetical protein